MKENFMGKLQEKKKKNGKSWEKKVKGLEKKAVRYFESL